MVDNLDRYPANPLDGPGGLADWMKGIESEIAALKRRPLSGTFTSPDDDGDPLLALGTLPDAKRGLQIVSSANGWVLAELTTEGWIKPHLMGVSIDPAAVAVVTAGTFTSTVGSYFGEALGPGIEIFCHWSTGVGTTGELQVLSNGGANTTAQALPAASSGSFFVRWLHDLSVGSGPFVVTMQARRTAGAGNVNISQVFAWVQDPALCSSGGTWIAV